MHSVHLVRTGEPRFALNMCLCGNTLSKCVRTAHTFLWMECTEGSCLLRLNSAAEPLQNVPRPAAHLNAPKGRASCGEAALHAAKPRFMCRRHASYPEGVLHLQHARAVILSFPPAQSGSGDTGKADRAAVKTPPSTPPAEQSPCRKTEQARCNHRSQR